MNVVQEQAEELLGESLAHSRAAERGADHQVVFASTRANNEVVIKVGEDALTDAYVLNQLQDLPILVPKPLASEVRSIGEQYYPMAVMTKVEGVDLATVENSDDYLLELIQQVSVAHRVTITGMAGTVRDVLQGTATPTWKAYLREILTGENREFDWEQLYASPLVDAHVLRHAIDLLLDKLQTLPEPTHYSLLHGDLNPYNILVNNGHIAGIIDWSYARYGDPLFDFARLRMNPFVRKSLETSATYFASLGLNADEHALEDFYFHFHLTEYINWYTQSNDAERVREHIDELRHWMM